MLVVKLIWGWIVAGKVVRRVNRCVAQARYCALWTGIL